MQINIRQRISSYTKSNLFAEFEASEQLYILQVIKGRRLQKGV